MQDAPPPPAYSCVQPQELREGSTFVTVSGDPAQVGVLLVELGKHPIWKLNADVTQNGVRFVRFSGPIDTPYREIGGIIFEAQSRRLSVAMTTDPLICEPEEK